MRFLLKTDYRQDLRLAARPRQGLWYGLLLVLALLAPAWASAYWVTQLGFVLVYAIAGLGLMLLAGYAGLISIGHAAFLGIGAYAQAWLVAHGWPFPLALAAAALLSGLAGVVVGLPALRVRGIYLAIATLAFGFIVEEVLARWESVTGGNAGMPVQPPTLAGVSVAGPAGFYYLALAVCVLVTLGLLNLLRSPTGRAFIAVRDSEISAQSMGIQLARYKTLAFALSAAIVGIAGGLYAHLLNFISPEQFGIGQSIDLLLLVVVGGLGSVHGAFFGALFLIMMPQGIALAKDWLPPAIGQASGLQAVVYGVVLMGFVLFEPMGLYGRWLKIRTYLELFPFYRQGMFRRQKAFQKSERLR
ncbi:branched-chain amino acid ABC transporter permease [Cupriavidus sp. USMAHM13]|uniref:Branched-chain amino acid ABC transporter permease n=1 Tax=Cupriavidus malaysiensis TaxID=367825 RepID=A0ABN4TEY6_9BURK|nr:MULTISPECIES: branched-chain amino acid ABC transporter permease [Cupriavidus]AOY99268.1 branched-chain amino acid ABC transporter permease [Cupriavidus sp. USMAHM13]AOZ05692.1 branched-chain amino acid ABC transporter permease [Cupriavidus malaysiensis]